jgi:hypothetical protein
LYSLAAPHTEYPLPHLTKDLTLMQDPCDTNGYTEKFAPKFIKLLNDIDDPTWI